MNKKHIFFWCLYDFANSFVFITFLLYFSKWLVVNRGLSDWWYNATYILGSIGLLFFAPYLGNKADRRNNGRRYLVLSTFGCFLFYALAVASAIWGGSIFFAATLFGLGNFFYQLSFVFYNPLLNSIASPEKQGRASGLGFLANYLGQICGILISLPLLSGRISLGVEPILAPMIPAVIVFIVLSLPLLFCREIFARGAVLHSEKAHATHLGLLKSAFALPGVLSFLLAFFLFSDAITTLVNNFSIFTARIFEVSESQISILTLLIIVCAGVSAPLWGALADRFGAKKILVANLIAWAVLNPIISWAENYSLYFAFALLAGICIGGTWTVSRRVLIELVPKETLNYAFGIYAISERASTFVGPLVWSMVLSVGGYRWAMFSLAAFQIASVFLIRRISGARPATV